MTTEIDNKPTEFFIPGTEEPGLMAFDFLKAANTAVHIMSEQIEVVSSENIETQKELIMSTVVMHAVLCTIIKNYTTFDRPSLFEATNLTKISETDSREEYEKIKH